MLLECFEHGLGVVEEQGRSLVRCLHARQGKGRRGIRRGGRAFVQARSSHGSCACRAARAARAATVTVGGGAHGPHSGKRRAGRQHVTKGNHREKAGRQGGFDSQRHIDVALAHLHGGGA